jgi:pimeloyl-ACP methyl ester carboxylesterase
MQESYWQEGGIYYRQNEFQPDRLTLVFIHGVSGSSSAWRPYEEKFKNQYNILTYDIRGHGFSKKYPHYEDYEVKKFAYDLHDLLAYLNVSKFILISNSFGGLVALEYIKLWGETVAANIFTSPEIYSDKELFAKILRAILKIATSIINLMSFDPKPRGQVDYSKHQNSTDWDIKRNLADMRTTGLHAHFYTLRQSMAPGQEDFLEEINIPTLIVHGEKDSMVPIKNAAAMAKKIKNCEFVSIPNVDHNTVHNAVQEMSGIIENFVQKLDK